MKQKGQWLGFILLVTAVLAGCKKNDNRYKHIHLSGYEGSTPSIVYLPETISQVSGFVYYPK